MWNNWKLGQNAKWSMQKQWINRMVKLSAKDVKINVKIRMWLIQAFRYKDRAVEGWKTHGVLKPWSSCANQVLSIGQIRKWKMTPRMQSGMNLQLENICYKAWSGALNSLGTGDLFKCELVKVLDIVQ